MTEAVFLCLYLCERVRESDQKEGGRGGVLQGEAQTELIYRETAASHC